MLQRLLRGKEQQIGYLIGHGEPTLDGRANFDLGSFGQQHFHQRLSPSRR
jgi:hypothetical protein